MTSINKDLLYPPKVYEKLPYRNILVLAPHPDDEVIGCGGSIIKHKSAKDKVGVVCLTDGCRGSIKCNKDENLIKIRKNEMKNAHKFIGIDESINLDLEDGKLKADETTVTKIKDIILRIKPDAIYLPTLIDYHSDHIETSKILMLSLKGFDYSGKIITYEINSALIPNIVVDISKFIDIKVKAMKFYESQLAVNDYIYTVIEGLNRYRTNGVMLGKGYAEGFFVCDAKYYQKLMEEFFSE